MRRALVSRIGCSIVVSALGCGNAGDEGREIGTAAEAIKGGYVDTGDTAVVGLYDQVAQSLCTGSLIAPSVVLTARHCVSPVLADENGVDCAKTSFGPLSAPDRFLVSTQGDLNGPATSVHRALEVVGLGTDVLCGEDLAMLILDAAVDPSEAIPLVPRVDVPLAAGEPYWAVGYGATEEAGSGSGVRRRRDGLSVSCVGEACAKPSITATEWGGDEGVCHGDSGGPAFDALGRIIGITSRGGLECSSPVYGYALGHADWIKATTIHGADVGGYSPPPWTGGWPSDPAYAPDLPLGDACAGPGDCASNECVDDGRARYCTRLCNAAAPCPDGYRCDDGAALCIWDPPPERERNHRVVPRSGCTVTGDASAASNAGLLVAFVALALARTLRRHGPRRSPPLRPARVVNVTRCTQIAANPAEKPR